MRIYKILSLVFNAGPVSIKLALKWDPAQFWRRVWLLRSFGSKLCGDLSLDSPGTWRGREERLQNIQYLSLDLFVTSHFSTRFVTEDESWKLAVAKAEEGRSREACQALGQSGPRIWWAVKVPFLHFRAIFCSSQPSMVHWLSSSIFPFCSFGCPAMVTPVQISLLVAPHPKTHTFSESLW